MYDHKLYRGRKRFCHHCFQAFSSEEILKCHIKDCFKIDDKQRVKMPKNGEHIRFKNYERKIKSFMIYEDFESTLVPEYNGRQNPNESYADILLVVMATN